MEVLCNLSTVHLLRWPSNDQLVDVFTKPLRGSQISYIYILVHMIYYDLCIYCIGISYYVIGISSIFVFVFISFSWTQTKVLTSKFIKQDNR